jgi:hypothetical protein
MMKNVTEVTKASKNCIKEAIRVKDVILMDFISFNSLLISIVPQ